MPTDTFEIYPPRLTTLLLTALGVGMTTLAALPIWLLWSGQGDPEELVFILPIAVIGIVFFGIATLTGMYALLSPRPILRVDAQGIHVWRYPSLTWEEFAGAEVGSQTGEGFLVLQTIDNAAFRARMVWYRRWWAKGNAALIEGAVYLSSRLISGNTVELAMRINAAAPNDKALS